MKDFYERCAEALSCNHEGRKFPHYKRTRWNNRAAGRGRYPGFGTIRKYGSVIHVCLRRPTNVNRVFEDEDEVIKFLALQAQLDEQSPSKRSVAGSNPV